MKTVEGTQLSRTIVELRTLAGAVKWAGEDYSDRELVQIDYELRCTLFQIDEERKSRKEIGVWNP